MMAGELDADAADDAAVLAAQVAAALRAERNGQEKQTELLVPLSRVQWTDAARRAFAADRTLPLVVALLDDLHGRAAWPQLEPLLQTLANFCKDASGRALLSEFALVPLALSVTTHGPESAKVQALRLLGNLLADDEARRAELTADGSGVEALLALACAGTSPAASRLACIVLLNYAIEEGPEQAHLLSHDALRRLMDVVKTSPHVEVLAAAGQLINALLASDEALEQFLALRGLEELIRLAGSSDRRILESALMSLVVLAEDERIRRPLYEHGCVDFCQGLVDSDQAIVVRRAAAKMVAMVLTNAASAGAATDDNMNDMFRLDRLQLFASWLSQPDPEIRACACLCISNLARTAATSPCVPVGGGPVDEHCRRVANGDLVPQLLGLLASDNAMEQNAAVGVFRNIVLPDENKALLVRRGLLPLLVGLLERGGASLKFTVLIVLKNLVLRTPENGEALVADARGLAAIAATFEASDHDGTCFEAARIYANLARLQRDRLAGPMLQHAGVAMTLRLTSSQFPLLRAEGYDALQFLGGHADSAQAVELARGLAGSLPDKLPTDAPAAQRQAVRALEALCADGPARQALQASPTLGDALRALPESAASGAVLALLASPSES